MIPSILKLTSKRNGGPLYVRSDLVQWFEADDSDDGTRLRIEGHEGSVWVQEDAAFVAKELLEEYRAAVNFTMGLQQRAQQIGANGARR